MKKRADLRKIEWGKCHMFCGVEIPGILAVKNGSLITQVLCGFAELL